jgi:ElaB/YqjD/DUF883 family membrane-anchored ribosome-binding protein
MAQRRKAAVRQRWQSTKDRVMGATSDTGNKMSDTASTVSDAIASVPQSAARVTEGNPLAVGMVAFGAGLVLATLLPETREEQKLAEKMQPAVEQAASALGASAQATAEHLKPRAQQAIDEVKASAQDSVQQVKDVTSEAASRTTQQAQR